MTWQDGSVVQKNKTFQINASGLITGFIDRYLLWQDNHNFHKSPRELIVEKSIHGIPCFHYSDISNINASLSKLIGIDCMAESLHSRGYFEQYDTNKKYIIFSNGDWDQHYHVLPIEYDLVHSVYSLFEISETYLNPNRWHYYSDKIYNFDVDKIYDFISTVGTKRPERDQAIELLLSMHPDRNFVLKYSGQDLAQSSDHLDVLTFTSGNFDPYFNISEKYYNTVSKSLPMNMYNSARFNLVFETDINYQHCFFLTEKTNKVLLTGMPFVAISHPDFLLRIKKLGFHTYDNLWDESYDQETDYQQRLKKIVQLCNDLCDFKWDQHRAELELIQYKNLMNFHNLHKVAAQEFQSFENIISKNIH